MENLNAEQIKKALECCTRGRKNKDDRPCDDCPYNECNLVGGTSERQIKGTCQGWLMKDALALITSQEQENANLHASCTEFEQKCASVKADTVRKMQEEVKARCRDLFSGLDVCIIVDQIANELLEGSDET